MTLEISEESKDRVPANSQAQGPDVDDYVRRLILEQERQSDLVISCFRICGVTQNESHDHRIFLTQEPKRLTPNTQASSPEFLGSARDNKIAGSHYR
jgi:hypothetical protein